MEEGLGVRRGVRVMGGMSRGMEVVGMVAEVGMEGLLVMGEEEDMVDPPGTVVVVVVVVDMEVVRRVILRVAIPDLHNRVTHRQADMLKVITMKDHLAAMVISFPFFLFGNVQVGNGRSFYAIYPIMLS